MMEDNRLNGSKQSGQEEKQRLVEQLERSRRAFLEALGKVDYQMVIYEESGWRVQDIVGHVAAWDRETLALIQMHAENDPYEPFEDRAASEAYNLEQYEKRKNQAPEQCRMDFIMVRRDLQFAISELDPDRMEEEVSIPWGGVGPFSRLIQELIDHEMEHRDEIIAVLER